MPSGDRTLSPIDKRRITASAKLQIGENFDIEISPRRPVYHFCSVILCWTSGTISPRAALQKRAHFSSFRRPSRDPGSRRPFIQRGGLCLNDDKWDIPVLQANCSERRLRPEAAVPTTSAAFAATQMLM
jgi:hypothetical protein